MVMWRNGMVLNEYTATSITMHIRGNNCAYTTFIHNTSSQHNINQLMSNNIPTTITYQMACQFWFQCTMFNLQHKSN